MTRPAVWFVTWVSLLPAGPLAAQGVDVDGVLDRRGRPAELEFLRGLSLQGPLGAVIARDVEQGGDPAAIAALVRDRLRLDSVASGAFPADLAARAERNAGARRNMPPLSFNLDEWQASQGNAALSPLAATRAGVLRGGLPDGVVERYARLRFGAGAIQQIGPGTDVTPPAPQAGPTVEPIPSFPRPGQPAAETAPASPVPGAATSPTAEPAAYRQPDGAITLPGIAVQNPATLQMCGKPFEQLSRSCGNPLSGDGRRCETFASVSFPEVVLISTPTGQTCTGTLVAERWVLTAAHCMVGDQTTGMRLAGGGADYVMTGPVLRGASLTFANDRGNPPLGAIAITRSIVHGGYDPRLEAGRRDNRFFVNDLALVELATAIPPNVVQPARIGTPQDVTTALTSAGYGYTDADGGALGRFEVSWPNATPGSNAEALDVDIASAVLKSGFCQGDSGGPAFAGRHRGCRVPAETPRTVLGVASFTQAQTNAPARPSGNNVAPAEAAAFCRDRDALMRYQSVVHTGPRRWICGYLGC
jgi:hypothetical protein